MPKADRLVFHAAKKEKRQSITITLSPFLIKELDRIATRCHRSRSSTAACFINLALTLIHIADGADL